MREVIAHVEFMMETEDFDYLESGKIFWRGNENYRTAINQILAGVKPSSHT